MDEPWLVLYTIALAPAPPLRVLDAIRKVDIEMKVYGHRGFAGIAPENTLASFKKALEVGVDGIEFDVHLSKDGHVVICHDPTVERTTGGTGMIKDLALRELQALDAGSWFSEEFSGERIPALVDLLELVSGYDITLNIELKTDKVAYIGLEEAVIQVLKAYNMVERCVISSFNFESLVKVKSLLPYVTTGALYKNMSDIPHFWETMDALGVSALHPGFRGLSPEAVAEAKRRGYVVTVWTPDEPSDIEQMIAFGVDGIISNYPDRVKSILSACRSKRGGQGGGA